MMEPDPEDFDHWEDDFPPRGCLGLIVMVLIVWTAIVVAAHAIRPS